MTPTKQQRRTLVQELEAESLYASHATLPIRQVLDMLDAWEDCEEELEDADQEVEELIARIAKCDCESEER